MKIVAWVCDQPNQMALLNKIHQQFPLAAIVTETRQTKRKITFKLLVTAVIERLFLRAGARVWWGLLDFYKSNFSAYPAVKMLDVENINSDEAYQFTKDIQPDLIIVSGTRLIKKKMFAINPGIGFINLHTGLSPYIKGGPNCTNWCIATEQFHLIGNTIMWLDAGIDTGNIITTAGIELSGEESLLDVHIKVMESGHSLYLESIKHLSKGTANNVPQQSIGEGKTYYNREWGLKQRYLLIRNFKKMKAVVKSEKYKTEKQQVKIISL
jgi:methionyl-tRNA formyltransferase